jgi:hypothetical protein
VDSKRVSSWIAKSEFVDVHMWVHYVYVVREGIGTHCERVRGSESLWIFHVRGCERVGAHYTTDLPLCQVCGRLGCIDGIECVLVL